MILRTERDMDRSELLSWGLALGIMLCAPFGVSAPATRNVGKVVYGRPAVVDFGTDGEGGYPEVTVEGVSSLGVKLRLSYATHPDGLAETGDFCHATRATYLGADVLLPIAPASTDRFDVFAITNAGTVRASKCQGLVRYVRIAVDTPGAWVKVGTVGLENRAVHSEEPIVGVFACSDDELTKIWRASVRTCQLSAVPSYEARHVNPPVTTLPYLADGAKRDRLVWSGDLWWAQRNMYVAFAPDSPYMRGSIEMLAENQTPAGYVNACPYPESRGPITTEVYGPFGSDEFAAWFVPVLADHYLYTGDKELLARRYPNAVRVMDYLSRYQDADGLFSQRAETAKHSEGLAVGGTSLHHRTYMHLLLWRAYVDAARMATWLDKPADAARFTASAARLEKLLRRRFFRPGIGRFGLSLEQPDAPAFVANAAALAFGFLTGNEAKGVLGQLQRDDHGKFQMMAIRGAFELKDGAKALELLNAHNWRAAVSDGWQGTHLTSECMVLHHAGWGDEAHPDTALAGVLTDYVLGVRPTSPGYETYVVDPIPVPGITWAKGRVLTRKGFIDVSWKLVNGRPEIKVAGPLSSMPTAKIDEWQLDEGAVREGSKLIVDVPKGGSGAAARAKIDLKAFPEGLECRIRCSGVDVSNPPESWLGLKFMLNYKDASGKDQWPQAAKVSGTFDGVELRFVARFPSVLADGSGTLTLGLQSASGKVVFDLDSLELKPAFVFRPPRTDVDMRCAYSKDFRKSKRRRGVMLSAGPVGEDDFKTLKSWGATLVRYQMMRNWMAENDNRDLVEYNTWLDGKLDHLDRTVLPLAEKYGLSVVVDLHVVPGGRRSGDMNMFYEPEYAEAFVACWRKIARRFKGRRNIYGYDLVNEPCQSFENAPDCGWWDLQRRAAEAVRAIDPDVTLIIESNGWDSPSGYEYMSPLAMTNVVYEVHMYHPDMFTHQQLCPERPASKWPDPEKGWTKDLIKEALAPVRAFERKYGAKIYVGEFSAIAWAEGADRYLRDCISVFDEYKWDWTYHAFREFQGWSVEHEGPDAEHMVPSKDNPRKRALLSGFRR